jgi:HEAT repeat protein
MTDFDYPEPVSQLLTLGDCRGMHQWPDFLALGIGPEHVPDLIRIVEDEELNGADSDSLEIWAPVHAWRDLGQLRAEAAIEPLIEILWRIDDEDEWVGEEVPTVLGMIGPAAVPKLTEYLADPGNGLWPRVAAAQALVEIGQRHPEAWADCVAVLTRNLEGFPSHEQTLMLFSSASWST